MAYLLLAVAAFSSSAQIVFGKIFDRRAVGCRNAVFTYTFFRTGTAAVLLTAVCAWNFSFHAQTVWFALAFAALFTVTILSTLFALRYGPVSLTSLAVSLSLILPSLYGILRLHEPLSAVGIVGLCLFVAAVVLIQFRRGEGRLTLRWALFVAVAFAANGSSGILQKAHQTAYAGLYAKEFLLLGMLFAFLFSAVVFALRRPDNVRLAVKESAVVGPPTGLFDVATNALVLALASRLPAAVLFPVLSAGSLVLSALASRLLFREKLSAMQTAGLIAGIAAVILLNL